MGNLTNYSPLERSSKNWHWSDCIAMKWFCAWPRWIDASRYQAPYKRLGGYSQAGSVHMQRLMWGHHACDLLLCCWCAHRSLALPWILRQCRLCIKRKFISYKRILLFFCTDLKKIFYHTWIRHRIQENKPLTTVCVSLPCVIYYSCRVTVNMAYRHSAFSVIFSIFRYINN